MDNSSFPFAFSYPWVDEDPLRQLRQEKLTRIEQGQPVYDLSMFNPDSVPPRLLLDKLSEAAVKPSSHRYAVSRGIRKLREAFANKYRSRFGVNLDPERQVCASMGTKDAVLHTLRVLTQPGQTVVMGTPVYPAHCSAARLCNLQLKFFDATRSESEMVAQIELLLADKTVRMVLLNFPSNPTGRVVSADFLQAVYQKCAQREVWVLNDFVYGEMGYEQNPTSLLKASVNGVFALETYSLSKAYNVPGWRVGALLGAEQVVHHVAQLKSHVDYGLFLPVQMAAAAALNAGDSLAKGTTQEYKVRAQVMLQGLKRLQWEVVAPQAGGCLWAKFPENWTQDIPSSTDEISRSIALCEKLFVRTGIVATPGALFDTQKADYVRFALVLPVEKLREMLVRLEDAQGSQHEDVGSAVPTSTAIVSA